MTLEITRTIVCVEWLGVGFPGTLTNDYCCISILIVGNSSCHSFGEEQIAVNALLSHSRE